MVDRLIVMDDKNRLRQIWEVLGNLVMRNLYVVFGTTMRGNDAEILYREDHFV